MLGRYSPGRDGESGQTGTETAVLVGLVALGLIIALIVFRGSLTDALTGSGKETEGAFTPPKPAVCDSSYPGACVPPAPPDLDCDDLRDLGIAGGIPLAGEADPHGLDSDGDGVGCNEP